MSNHSENNKKPVGDISRRDILFSAGTGTAFLFGGSLTASVEHKKEENFLKRSDKIKLDKKFKEIIQKAYDLGYQYEKQYGG